jgi:hypothetical protein
MAQKVYKMKQNTPGTPSSIGTEASNQKAYIVPSYEEFAKYDKIAVNNWLANLHNDFTGFGEYNFGKVTGKFLLESYEMMNSDEFHKYLIVKGVSDIDDRYYIMNKLGEIKKSKGSESKGRGSKRYFTDEELGDERFEKRRTLYLDFDSIRQYIAREKDITPDEKYQLILNAESLQSELFGREEQVQKAVETFCKQFASVVYQSSKNQNFSCIMVTGISGAGKTRFSVELYFKIREFVLNSKNKDTVLQWCIPVNPPPKLEKPEVVYNRMISSFNIKSHCYIYAKQTNGMRIGDLTPEQYVAALLIASHPRFVGEWSDIALFVFRYDINENHLLILTRGIKNSINCDILHICIVIDEMQEKIDWANGEKKRQSPLYKVITIIMRLSLNSAKRGVHFLLIGCGTITIPIDLYTTTGYNVLPIPMTSLSVLDGVNMLSKLRADITEKIGLQRTELLVAAVGSLPLLLVSIAQVDRNLEFNADTLFQIAVQTVKTRYMKSNLGLNDMLNLLRIVMSYKKMDDLEKEDKAFATNWIAYGILQENEKKTLYIPFIILIYNMLQTESLIRFGSFFEEYILRILKGDDYVKTDFEKLVANFLHLKMTVLLLLGIKQIPFGDVFPFGKMHSALRSSMMDIPTQNISCYFDLTEKTKNDYINRITQAQHKGSNLLDDFTEKNAYIAHIDNEAEDVEISIPSHIIMIECKHWSENKVPIVSSMLSVHPNNVLQTKKKSERNTFLYEQNAAEEQFRKIVEKYPLSSSSKKKCIFVFCCNAEMSDDFFKIDDDGILEVSWKEGTKIVTEKIQVLHSNSIIISKSDNSLEATFPLLLLSYLVPNDEQKKIKQYLKEYFHGSYDIQKLKDFIDSEQKELDKKRREKKWN